MKYIVYPEGDFGRLGDEVITSRKMLKMIVEQSNPMTQGGITFAEFQRRSRIMKAMAAVKDDGAGEFLALEDGDYNTLKDLVNLWPFGQITQALENLYAAINEPQSKKPKGGGRGDGGEKGGEERHE